MPDPVTHYIFGKQVLEQLPENIQKMVQKPIYQRALQGPDPWSTLGFFGGKAKQFSRRGGEMHHTKTGQFLNALMKQSKCEPALFSVLIGATCHYCLDRLTHPYIICKAGYFDGSERTSACIGGHTRLERAIDSYYIRTEYGKKPWFFSLPRNVLSCRQFPETLRRGLNTVYWEIYGWENAFPLINQCLRDERFFYGLMQDPFGIVHMLLRIISGGKTNYSVFSFFHREINSEKLDYFNETHAPWQHPYDPSVISTASFFDLFDQAQREAIDMIEKAFAWIIGDENTLPENIFGNSNYSTGFDCVDKRNANIPLCQPLLYSGKYWN